MVRRIQLALTLLVLVAVASGCATQGEKMVTSYADTREGLADAIVQLDQTLWALAALQAAPADSIKGSYNEYEDQVEKLADEGEDVKRRASAMKSDAEAHIKAWEKEQAEIEDPEIKATLQSRQQAVRTNFALLKQYADDVRARYAPFLKRNKDIVQALSIDLSPQTVASLSPTFNQVMSDGLALKERMTSMQRALANIADGRSAIAP